MVACAHPVGAATAASSNAIGILYAEGPFLRSYSAAAEMALPAQKGQHSWHAVWLMLVNGGGSPPGFVQGGLIRWSEHRYRLSAFIAMALPNRALVFKDLGLVSNGPHRVELAGDTREVWLFLDGKLRYRFRRARYLRDGLRPYLQIGAEVKYPPDRASGEVWDIRLKRDTDMHARPFTPRCSYEDRGVRLVARGGRYVARGAFDPRIASAFTDCAGFNQPASR